MTLETVRSVGRGWSRPLVPAVAVWPWLLLAIALSLRLGLIIATPHFSPNNDPRDYDQIARSIANGHGFPATLLAAPGSPTALRPPGYPLLLAFVYLLGGHWLAGRVINALLGSLVVLLVYATASMVWDRRHAVIAGALAAVFPPLIALNGSLLSEPLFILLELLVVLGVLRYQGTQRRLLYAIAIGVVCAAAALTRSVGVLLPVAAAVGIWVAPDSSRRQALGSVGAMLVAMALVIAPWAIRNADAFHGAFVPISTQDGITAAGTYNSQAATPGPLYAVWRPPFLVPSFKHLFGDSINEAQMDGIFRNDALSYAEDHPGYALDAIGLDSLRLAYIGPGHAFVNRQWYYEMGIPPSLQPAISLTGDVVIALALIGAAVAVTRMTSRRRRARAARDRRTRFVWLVPLFMFATVVPIQGAFRYRAPVDPFLLWLAAYALVAGGGALKGRREPTATRPPATSRIRNGSMGNR